MSTNDAGTGGESNLQKEVSLFKQRKDLVAAINAVVNQFNESSKINQSMNNSTRNMSSMVTKGNDIMEQVDWIEGQIAAAKAHAADLNQKLDDLNLYFKDFDAKYDHKNDLVDACDDLFDNCEDEIKALDA
jgi:chromosome segregation ATPase